RAACGDRSRRSDRRPAGAAGEACEGTTRLASLKRPVTAAGDDPRRGRDLRDRTRGFGDRARAVPLRPAIRSLAWPDAAAELQWRQGAAWSDLAHGRSLSAPAVGGWHDLAHPPRQSQARVGRSEAAGAAPAQADAARNRRRS